MAMSGKVIIFVILAIFGAFVSAQDTEHVPVDKEEQVIEFQDKVLLILTRRIAAANLPAELNPEAQAILDDTTQGLQECQEQLKIHHLIGLYNRCAALQLAAGNQRITALQYIATVATSSGQ